MAERSSFHQRKVVLNKAACKQQSLRLTMCISETNDPKDKYSKNQQIPGNVIVFINNSGLTHCIFCIGLGSVHKGRPATWCTCTYLVDSA